MLPLHIFSMFLSQKAIFQCMYSAVQEGFFMLGRKPSHSVFYLNDEDVSINRSPKLPLRQVLLGSNHICIILILMPNIEIAMKVCNRISWNYNGNILSIPE